MNNMNMNGTNKKKPKFKLKLNKKVVRVCLPIFVLALVVVLFIGIGSSFIKPANKVGSGLTISDEIKKNKTYQDLTIEDISIEEGENIVHLMANIYNHGEAFADRMVNIVFLDSNGKEIGKTPTYISAIEKDGAIRIDTVIDRNFAKAHTFKVEE